ncbi:MAG: LytR C-terminal domain-containing protein [Candidatus Dojkabacteria bacterium]|jgi:hypothetical protein|nr:LytR C-terminal domain-containing protein [Candidatus Dojkabacteria bacterium]
MSSGRERYKKSKEKKGRKSLNIGMDKILLFLFLIGILAYGIYTYIGFSNIKSDNPLKNSNSDYYLLSDKKDDLEKTLIVFEEEYNEKEVIKYVYLYAENKEKSKSVLIYLPGWLEYRGLEKDFGTSVSISAFRYAGEFIQDGRGFEYAIWQLEQLLGSNIDQYIWFSAQSLSVFQDKLGTSSGDSVYAQYYNNGFDVSDESFFFNNFVSKLGWFNLLMSSSKFKDSEAVIYSSYPTLGNIVVELKNIHSSTLATRPYIIDFSNAKYLSQQVSSGTVGITSYINISEYDTVWRGFVDGMIDRELEKERARVEIYNGSGLSGYAAQYSRRIRNSGIEVVRYDNAPQKEEKTKFYVPNIEDFPNSLQTVQEIFPGTYEIIEGRPSFMTTGDIVIILGKDIPTVYSF